MTARIDVLLEPVHAVDLAVQVLAGQQAVGVVLVGADVEPLPVHALAEERQPAGAVLDRHELEVGVAVAHAAEDDLGDVLGVAEQHQRALPGEVHLLGLVDRALEVLGRRRGSRRGSSCSGPSPGPGRAAAPSGRRPGGAGRPCRSGRRRARPCGPARRPASSRRPTSSMSQNGSIIIGIEPARVGRAPLDEPVVVGPHALGGQLAAASG